jgi:hypothetical protein
MLGVGISLQLRWQPGHNNVVSLLGQVPDTFLTVNKLLIIGVVHFSTENAVVTSL